VEGIEGRDNLNGTIIITFGVLAWIAFREAEQHTFEVKNENIPKIKK